MTNVSMEMIKLMKMIPKGKVATYGQIAKMAGLSNGARQVVRLIHTCSEKFDIPWHRIVSSKGQIGIKDPIGHNIQKQMLEKEGINFDNQEIIDLNLFQWTFEESEILSEN